MKAKFIGDPKETNPDLPVSFNHLGLTFLKGKFTDVPDRLAPKFEGNSHFETQGHAPEPVPVPVTVNPATGVVTAAPPRP